MTKDTFYFSHDYNARNDEKIKRLIRKHGMIGYGIFWSIVEDLYNNANALQTDYDGIAFDLRTDSDLVASVVNDFDLFVFDGDFFGSNSVQERLDQRNNKSESARKSASYRWNNANAMQTLSDSNAKKERKGKEIKEINTPKGVASPNPKTKDLLKKESKEDWKDFENRLEFIGDDQPSPEKKAQAQRIAIKDFIDNKKPKYPEPYFLAYRFFASKEGIPIPETLSESRKRKLLVRLKEDAFDFYAILEGIHISKFCKGDNNRNWTVDWDWIIENDSNYIKIIERKFE